MVGYQCFHEMYCLSLKDRNAPSWESSRLYRSWGKGETGVNNQGHRSGHCYSAMRLCHAVHFNIMLSVFKKWQICFIFNYLDVHLKLTPWGRVHLEKLALDHLVKMFSTFSRTHVFIIVFAVALVFFY